MTLVINTEGTRGKGYEEANRDFTIINMYVVPIVNGLL